MKETEKVEIVREIFSLSKKLGPISQLAFRSEEATEILEVLRELYDICIHEEKEQPFAWKAEETKSKG